MNKYLTQQKTIRVLEKGSSRTTVADLLVLSTIITITSIYLALGSSCAGDVARLQSHVNYSGTEILEPGSSLLLNILGYFFPSFEVPILHGLAHILICIYCYYFIVIRGSRGRLSPVSLCCYIVAVFNPISFELVAHNTRQLFSFGCLMASIICLDFYRKSIYGQISQTLTFKQRSPLRRLLWMVGALIFGLISLTTHTTTPSAVIFIIAWSIVYSVYIRGQNIRRLLLRFLIGRLTKLQLITCASAFLAIPALGYVFASKGIERFTIYFVEQTSLEYKILGFDTTSVSLVASLIWIFIFLIYILTRNDQSYFTKSLALTLMLWLMTLSIIAYQIPLLSEVFRRLYQPIILLALPILLAELLGAMRTPTTQITFLSLLLIMFVLSIALQFQKLANNESEGDTFYSLGNTMSNSCLFLRPES